MRNRLLAVSILGISFIIGSILFGLFFYESRQPQKTIRVVGLATRRFDSDIIKWRVTLARSVGQTELKKGYGEIESDRNGFVAFLKAHGIDTGDITIQPVNTNPVYSQNGGLVSGYSIQQNLFILSDDVGTVEKLALEPSTLVDKGIFLQSSNLEYYYSKLDMLKRSLLAAATGDAKKRAAEIAKSTGDRIAKIASAHSGVFQITEPYSTEVMDYGVYNTAGRTKDITVTVNVVFNLH
ncbi:hypothetical protein EDC14_101337 [Hydrogenispora ethanolica]|jgi:hypothetical protein|uniref:SIMPL domain-containing protein n=1 Tax=Hydrogenispora ethanolica TaxID=1082276 RepID=A0A4V2QEL6_HYDET|nr:SIMPL domain-containing protein [Hydrogenispora ethanolica]TCL68497.1 hypothetical protein EDC14_101337 [Hydrogenispora ethanolica]